MRNFVSVQDVLGASSRPGGQVGQPGEAIDALVQKALDL